MHLVYAILASANRYHKAMPDNELTRSARDLAAAESVGTLSTHSVDLPGYPFGSVVQFALDSAGHPLLLLSSLARHTQNILADPRASLLIAQSAPPADALVSARLTFIGEMEYVPPEDSEVRSKFLARHPDAEQWVDFGDFSFFRLKLKAVYYVGGFGVMGWVEVPDFTSLAAS